MTSIYLDNSATTRSGDTVIEKMTEAMRICYGNPSSLHNMGLEAYNMMKASRNVLADYMNVREQDVVFTSGGTESINSAIFSLLKHKKLHGGKIISTKVEHPATLEALKYMETQGFEVVQLPVDVRCQISLDELRSHIDDKTVMISIMSVNNEVGAIMPIEEIAKLKKGAILHCDAVQGFCKVDKSLYKSADIVSISGHKLHGPKGIGALYFNSKAGYDFFRPLIVGGGQEMNYRSGTENTPAVIGIGEAVREYAKNESAIRHDVITYKNRLLEAIEGEIKDIRVNSTEDGSPYILNVSFYGVRGEVLLHSLETEGIYVSTGSACSSKKKGSHVLRAMGIGDKWIEGAIRFSMSRLNKIDEVERVVGVLKDKVEFIRKMGSFR